MKLSGKRILIKGFPRDKKNKMFGLLYLSTEQNILLLMTELNYQKIM